MYLSSFSSSTEGCSQTVGRARQQATLGTTGIKSGGCDATEISVQTRPTDPSNVTHNAVKLKTKIGCSVSFTARTEATAHQTGGKVPPPERLWSVHSLSPPECSLFDIEEKNWL